MNKKCTLLSAAFVAVSAFSAGAQVDVTSVSPADWTAGSYYYLKADSNVYLSLSGDKPDSVIVKSIEESKATKAAIDSALWQITPAGTTPAGIVYAFKNKATQAVLSFAASEQAKPILAQGIHQWTFGAGGAPIQAYYGKDGLLALKVEDKGTFKALTLTGTSSEATKFTVALPPKAMPLSAEQLGEGFRIFRLNFNDTYQDNPFAGKNLLAKATAAPAKGAVPGAKYVTLQEQGDETYPDGKTAKYFGVDTTKNIIAGAKDVFGARFVQDSTYAKSALHTLSNANFQKFYFTIDLRNDSLAMYVAAAPAVNATPQTAVSNVRVVYARVKDAKVLTVAKVASNQVAQGSTPLITIEKGTPSSLPMGSGVYFLKSASKGADGGKYIATYHNSKIVTMGDTLPSVYLPRGQWYIQEKEGKYSVVDRQTNNALVLNSELFSVQGMPNTYTFGNLNDSITVEYAAVNLKDKYLGSMYFTEKELAENGYALHLMSGTSGVDNLYAFTADSLLQLKACSVKEALLFKLIPHDTLQTGGALQLGDTLSVISYELRARFGNELLTENATTPKVLKLSASDKPLAFTFNSTANGAKYLVKTKDNRFVSTNVSTSFLGLTAMGSGEEAYFTLTTVDAPTYGSFVTGHRTISSDAKYLTMNPYTHYAEMKAEGQEILRADYSADNFSLWVEQADTVVPGKTLYYISSALRMPGETIRPDKRYYLTSLRDSGKVFVNNDANYYRVGFQANDSLVSEKESPALFAFRSAEEGGFYLENQKELHRQVKDKTPYLGYVNGVVVLQSDPIAVFDVKGAAGPTSNEVITTSETIVVAGTGCVTVKNASGKKITLSNILGKTLRSVEATSDNFVVPAERGILIVAIEGEPAQKVLIR